MKKILALSLVLICSVMVAQNKQINTANTKYDNYIKYDKDNGKTAELEKAQVAIDEAMTIIEEKKAANDPKLKEKTIAKALHYKGLIYNELASLPDSDMKADYTKVALEAIKESAAIDPSFEYLAKYNILETVRIGIFNDGVEAFKGAQFEKAYNAFTEALDLYGLVNKLTKNEGIDTTGMAMAAYSAQNAGKTAEAVDMYKKLIDLKYNDEQVYVSLSNLYMAEGKEEEARAVIEQGKAAFPESNEFLIGEINYLLKQEKVEEAIAKMEEATDLYPDNHNLHFALGTQYEGMDGLKDKAEASYMKALEIKPDYFDALYNLGAMYFNGAADKYKAANALDFSKQKEYDQLVKEGEELMNKAIPYFEEALKANAEDAATMDALKQIHTTLGNTTEAKKYKEMLESK